MTSEALLQALIDLKIIMYVLRSERFGIELCVELKTNCSPAHEWEDFEHANHMKANANSNYNLYLDISIIFNNAGMNNNETFQDEPKLMRDDDDDDDVSYLEDYLIKKGPPYYVNEKEERSKEKRCKLLGIPYGKPPTCKSEKVQDEPKLMRDDDDDVSYLEDYLIKKGPPYYVNEKEERSKEKRCKLLGIPYGKPPTCKSEKVQGGYIFIRTSGGICRNQGIRI
uniref:Uncharacterized protein n=1 Tax=Tanacetum cinerariifolium TaxID=118510 RepID=A0A699ILP6_TANCI|nr:hypothetical protein [Tanacetum cinerariifolium]